STVSTWGVEFMMELPFIWIFTRGRAAPRRPSGTNTALGGTSGRPRPRAPGARFRKPFAAPAVRWIKARPRTALPLNQAPHLGTGAPEGRNRAGARTACRRLLHKAHDFTPAARLAHPAANPALRAKGAAGGARLCRSAASRDPLGYWMCRFPEARIPV